ncbi:alpha-L-arabinofuranosidase C-terminal domain-containing protein [Pedobacter sp. MR22-3]|uniref:alpha-L-arabinofuranosidase C-terminal domain-containing protein n=1 Tax=Pedobacter sp. MR22-3 TaxID=2994552 RepID=UPI0022458CB7|nr:alpha-L-arabinofuranosidase C-terminal domain-containing protein [Pedobacter sp. MR22-3]MCX2583129.1 carbohydrate binding domain-containing protein [Pedobacter sp. MR22-3]
MKFYLRFYVLFAILFTATASLMAKENKLTDEPDSAYLFAYNANGLRFAWSRDQTNWTPIGKDYLFLKSDYGRWGSEKKMISPYVIRGRNGEWVCAWELNDQTNQFAIATSKNLINWGPQHYPYVAMGKNVLKPVVDYNQLKDEYSITYADVEGKHFQTRTKDFIAYEKAVEVPLSAFNAEDKTANISGHTIGQSHYVAWSVIKNLQKAYDLQQYKARQNSETTKDDTQRFAGLKPVDAKITIDSKGAKAISNMLTGIFFEDINYAADGGLYAELIQNRGFEYQPSDKSFHDKNWNSSFAWKLKGDQSTFTVDSIAPVHQNNPHHAVLDVKVAGAALSNTGFDGIAVKKGDAYLFSAFSKQLAGRISGFEVRLVSDTKGILAKITLKNTTSWKKVSGTFYPSADATDARLEIMPLAAGKFAFDMVSLFPQKTFKGHQNGLRDDLATLIADIHPKFVRFPGGCLAHGDGIQNIYKWKNTIGALETRKPDRNLWGYHQTMGLGYFEYFQFCEDIGAAPVPVIAAAVPCQNSGTGGGGQQGGIPMEEMDQYIQDIVDLVEYANGDVHTTWGKKRAEAGHPKPFNLKYIGIGNEDQITQVFKERFTMIYQALRKKHPEITIIGTAGPFFEGTDYEEGWKIATDLKVPIIDEHYYQSPGWFINNQNFYDQYDRSKSKVYLGEYAASMSGGNKTNLETALAEALYLTSLERNGDVVSMASYAPLIAKEGHTQWNPDLIYFNNSEVKPTTGYFVQQLYGNHAGDQYLPGEIKLSNDQDQVSKRIAFSVVKNTQTNELFVKLVNLLPVEVNTTLDLGGQIKSDYMTTKTEISGNPSERLIKPITSTVNLKDALKLPAYSFTVLKIKLNK